MRTREGSEVDPHEHIQKIPEGGITSPRGFQAAGAYCGIKKDNGVNKDISLLFSEKPAAAAGTFTQNLYRAAPVELCRERLKNPIQAIIINSGNANACVGSNGYDDALEMGRQTARKLDVPEDSVLVASTGVIGERLPLDNIRSGIEKVASNLNNSQEAGDDAGRGILTTDTAIKKSAYRSTVNGVTFTVGGMAKGSGMICPNMATMLAYITTDLSMDREVLQESLQKAVCHSFNLVTVDGDTSTNDMAVVLANGASGEVLEKDTSAHEVFYFMLQKVCRDLAYQIAADGEGVNKVISLQIKGAPNYEDARTIAQAVLNSLLVKTAIHGEDANWGRILAAMGYSGVDFDPHKVDLYLGHIKVAGSGQGTGFNEEDVLPVLQGKEVPITIDMNAGPEEILAWGNDLSHDYVSINADYRS